MNHILSKKNLFSDIGIFIMLVVVSFVVRLIGLNLVGHAWDEYAYVGVGDTYLQLIGKGDFNNPEWYAFPDHPPLARYVYGMAGQLNVTERASDGGAIFAYDWTAPRVLSVLASSLAVGFTFLIGAKAIHKHTGIGGAVILMLLPLAIGYSQLITLESIVLALSTSAIYFFIRYLETYSLKDAVITAVLLGCALATKYTNVFLGLILGAVWISHLIQQSYQHKKSLFKIVSTIDKKVFLIPVVAVCTLWLLWPALWLHPVETFQNIHNWSSGRMVPASEYYFGTLQPVPWHYFLGSLLVTTPVLVLLFLVAGIYFYSLNLQKQKFAGLLLLWLCIPLLQSFYPLRQNGIRYVIMLYPALALLASYGIAAVSKKFEKSTIELPYYLWTVLIGSLLLSLYFVYPYYLDYYNFLTGGNTKVYEKKLFEFAYWGQGQREAMMILSKNARPGSTVGLAVIPEYVAPTIGYLPTGVYQSDFEFDYVVTNAFREYRSNIREELQNRGYVPVHYVNAGGAPITTIWASKKTINQL
jgi:4-amino-4-deoxy-L-arabinose transferase-like glycosyltransferase